MEYKLRPLYDSRKSFYNKAIVIENDGNKKLRSYQTIVCEIKNEKPIVYGTYSNTTTRHIKEFLKQNGFNASTTDEVRTYFATEKEQTQADQEAEEKSKGMFNVLKGICAIGDLMNNTDKAKNDWKARMLKAGLENKGLSFPDDWETLTEKEKAKRLNGAIEQL